VLDAVYKLPIVRCDCGHVAVRRRHPLTVRWRRAMLIAAAVARLVLQLILVALLSIFTASCVRGLEHDLRNLKYTPISFLKALFNAKDHERLWRAWGVESNGFLFLMAFVSVALASGVWLRTGLAHWRWPRQFLAWILFVVIITWIDVIFWPLSWALGRVTHEASRYDGPTLPQSVNIATVLGMNLIVTLLGTPMGYGLARLGPRIHGYFFTRRLAKYRKRRRAS